METVTPPETAPLYAALLARSAAFDGRIWVGVTSTGIYCRLTCPARKPLFRNCKFLPSIDSCHAEGLRPCKRCAPDTARAVTLGDLAPHVADAPLNAERIDTPLGPMIAIGDAERLHLVDFFDRKRLAKMLARLGPVRHGASDPVQSARGWLAAYFDGHPTTIRTPLALPDESFTGDVWRGLCQIPFGARQTYRDMANRLGRPDASRAVGRANGANPFAILVPCHRLVSSGGALTDYGGGLWRKDWLLRHETRTSERTLS